jgi:hypothetical protein
VPATQVRVLLALFMDAVLFGSVTLMSAQHPGSWCIYLTHWTLVAVCAHLTLSLAGALAARRSLARGDPCPPRPWWLPVLWSAQAIALPGSLLVFVLFWHAPDCLLSGFTSCALTRVLRLSRALVFPGYPPAKDFPINYFVHGANFGAMALDALLSTAPYFFIYIWSSWLVYAVIYVVFTIVFFRVGGTDENGNVRSDGLRCLRASSALTRPHMPIAAIHLCRYLLGQQVQRSGRGAADRHHRVRHRAAARIARLLACLPAPLARVARAHSRPPARVRSAGWPRRDRAEPSCGPRALVAHPAAAWRDHDRPDIHNLHAADGAEVGAVLLGVARERHGRRRPIHL